MQLLEENACRVQLWFVQLESRVYCGSGISPLQRLVHYRGAMKLGLVHCMTHIEYWDLAFETACMMLPSEEQEKHNFQYYKEIYGPFLYK